MSQEAIKYKKNNPNLDYKNMSLNDLNNLPLHNGVINFKINEASFAVLNILNDDSSAVKFFWKDSHDNESLNLWYEISKEEGLFIDVGAHTGLYTITALKANSHNNLIAIEPFYLNMARLITNLRLNGFKDRVDFKLAAVSNFNGEKNFNIKTEFSYLSKGGKIDNKGELVNVISLDELDINKFKKKVKGIKIDTEGEDYNVLLGSKNLIKKFKPKIIIEIRDENKNLIEEFFNKFQYTIYDISDTTKKINLNKIMITNAKNFYAQPSI